MSYWISLNPHDPRQRAAHTEKARVKGLATQARLDRVELHQTVLDLLTALDAMRAVKVSASFIDEIARGAHDEFTNLDKDLRRDIDAEAGPFGPLNPAEPLESIDDLREFFAPEAA